MSLQTQAILPGHPTAAEIADLLQETSGFKVLGYRTMRVPEHVLFELEDADGTLLAVEAFLNSWASDDYAAAYAEPSTLLTTQFSPSAVSLLRGVTLRRGLLRETDMAEWVVAIDARS